MLMVHSIEEYTSGILDIEVRGLMVNTMIHQTALIKEHEHTNYMTEIYFYK